MTKERILQFVLRQIWKHTLVTTEVAVQAYGCYYYVEKSNLSYMSILLSGLLRGLVVVAAFLIENKVANIFTPDRLIHRQDDTQKDNHSCLPLYLSLIKLASIESLCMYMWLRAPFTSGKEPDSIYQLLLFIPKNFLYELCVRFLPLLDSPCRPYEQNHL